VWYSREMSGDLHGTKVGRLVASAVVVGNDVLCEGVWHFARMYWLRGGACEVVPTFWGCSKASERASVQLVAGWVAFCMLRCSEGLIGQS
jgi:hypothetical protein